MPAEVGLDVDPSLEVELAAPARFEGDEGLRERATRGVIVNSAFQVGFAVLGLVQRFAVAAFLTVEEFGLWGIILTTFITLSFLKQIGISDKYVQQDDADQEVAFQKAFTLELAYTLIISALIALVLPLFALVYGRSEMLLPTLVLVLCLIGGALQTPIWIYYRRMQFVRQRLLEAINPVVGTVVTIGLAIAGAGYWSLVIGMVFSTWLAGIVVLITCPYRLRLRLDRKTIREYVGFSWPLLLASGSGLLVIQATLIIGNYTVGLAGLGALALAASLLTYVQRVGALISRTIYPAVCAVKDQRDLLFEAFSKSNRLGIMWGLPFGLGMLLFAPDLIEFVLGEKWTPAQHLLQFMGLLLGLGQVGVNWPVFYQAIGETRPLAVNGIVALACFVVATAPLMIVLGLTGFMIGTAITFIVALVVRALYLRRLFSEFQPIRHLFRGILPSLPAVGVVLLVRLADQGEPTLGVALAELALYILVTLAATLYFERRLLKEIFGYLRGRAKPEVTPDAAPGVAA